MGRRRKHDLDMPARVYRSKGWWFFVPRAGPQIKLAREDDKPGALRAYAAIMDAIPRAGTVGDLLDRYCREVLPAKAPKTQREQIRQAEKLRAVFGAMPLTSVATQDVAGYLDASPAKVLANREVALLSHAYTKAIRWGLTSTNPCAGVERNREKSRTRYVSHDELLAVLDCAPPVVRVAMALAYLTGQREGDLLRLKRDAIGPQGITIRQSKTGRALVIGWSPALAWAVEQAGQLPAKGLSSFWLLCQRNGQPYSSHGFQIAWQRHMRNCIARALIAERYTFHDIRAKAGSDAKDGRLLGHLDPATLRSIYIRKPELVRPTT